MFCLADVHKVLGGCEVRREECCHGLRGATLKLPRGIQETRKEAHTFATTLRGNEEAELKTPEGSQRLFVMFLGHGVQALCGEVDLLLYIVPSFVVQ